MPVEPLVESPQDSEAAGADHRRRWTALRMLANAAHLYRLRVRAQPLQELLAAVGIAAGVALFFAVQVASTSITGSWREMSDSVTGKATIEIASRSADGMDQQDTIRAAKLPGVAAAAPVLERRVTVGGPAGRSPVTVVGVDERLEELGGRFIRRFVAKGNDIDSLGLFMTSSAAAKAGLSPGDPMTIESGGTVRKTILAGLLEAEDIDDLSNAPVAIAPLGLAQRLTGTDDRISRILIVPTDTGGLTNVKHVFGDRFNVRPIDTEVALLGAALKPDRQSNALVSAIAMLIGLLFAYNAMLLAMATRRRQIAELRLLGADRRTIIVTLTFAAGVLGLVASIAGVLLGDLLSRVAFGSVPEYIAAGFAVGGQRVVEAPVVAISILAGLTATALASALPITQLIRVTPGESHGDAESVRGSRFARRRLLTGASGITVAAVATALAWLAPVLTPLWVVLGVVGLLALATVLWTVAFARLSALSRLRAGAATNVAVLELAGNPVRAMAITLIAAGAMVATLTIGGSKLDLQRGISRLTNEYFKTSELWVLPADPANAFQTQRFDPEPLQRRLSADRLVASTAVSRWEFYDVGGRRLLMIVPPLQLKRTLVPSQLREGDLAQASERIRRGGWVALSTSVAEHLGTGLGRSVVLPTPSGPHTFRVAAITANHGWPSGSIVIGNRDYDRTWRSQTGSAIGIDFSPGVGVVAGERATRRMIRPGDALIVRTPTELVKDRMHAFVQGLARLRQLTTMVLGASVLAVVAAMFAAVWQRRRRLAALRAIGMSRRDLGRALLMEMSLVVAFGCLGGLPIALYGQYIASHWTAIATDYNTPFAPAIGYGLKTFGGILVLAALATLVPVLLATRVDPDIHDDACD